MFVYHKIVPERDHGDLYERDRLHSYTSNARATYLLAVHPPPSRPPSPWHAPTHTHRRPTRPGTSEDPSPGTQKLKDPGWF
eukprot:6371302-Pyramimonas_sp.AAC.1